MRSPAELDLMSARLAKARAEQNANPTFDDRELLALKLVADSINWCRGESNCIDDLVARFDESDQQHLRNQ